MEFLSDENISMLCEIHDNVPVSFEMMKNYATLFIKQSDITQINMDDLLVLNKNFLIHLHAHYQTFRNTTANTFTHTNVEYVNEYVPPIPPTPSFLVSSIDDEGLAEGPLNVLIQQKLKERENELLSIQQYNSHEEQPESVKLIKISNILTDLPLLEIEEENLSQDKSKKNISIGDTFIFEYGENDPPNKTINTFEVLKLKLKSLYTLHETYLSTLREMNEIIEHMENELK